MLILALLALSAFVVPQDDTVRQARELIERLRSDKIEEREEATTKLKELGLAAIPTLDESVRGADTETQARINHILAVIRTRQKLPARLMQTLPGVDERLAKGTAQEWTAVFLDAASEAGGRPKFPAFRREDLSALVESAFQGAVSSKEKKELCRTVVRWHLEKVSGWVSEFLRDSDASVRQTALETLGNIGDSSRVGNLLSFIKDSDEGVRAEAYWALAKLGTPEVYPRIRALLGDEDQEVRRKAVSLLGAVGDKDSVANLVHLLSDETPLIRANAALSLALLGAKEDVPAVARLLEDPVPTVRGLAISALAKMNAKIMTPRILELLKDPEGMVRFYAVQCLTDWSAGEKSGDIARLVKDSERFVRQSALQALGILGPRQHRETIAGALNDSEEVIRFSAITALSSAGEAEEVVPLLRPLLRDPDDSVRRNAAAVLCDFGNSEGVSLLLANGSQLACLNALRRNVEWRSFRNTLKRAASGSRLEVLQQIANEVGLRLDLSRMSPADGDTWLSDKVSFEHFVHVPLAKDAIELLLWNRACWVLDESVLKLLPPAEATIFWQQWWAKKEKK